MKLNGPGVAAALVAFALLFSFVLFRDLFIGAAFFVVLMIMASEAAWVRMATRRPETKFNLTRMDSSAIRRGAILYPGDKSVERVRLEKRVGGEVEFTSNVSFLEIEPKLVRRRGFTALEFKFETEYAGEYSGDQIGLTIRGPLGFFSSECKVRFPLKYAVYPRVVQVAAATVKLLGKTEIGETPIETPGTGSEYYEMRGYQPGDDYRNVNWKATARLGEPMVMEHMKEVGGSYLLILDARAPGFRETDDLASTFLSIANSLEGAGVSFGILVHDGESVLEVSSQLDPKASLRAALKAAFRIARLYMVPEFLELIPAKLPMALRSGGVDSETILSAMAKLRKDEMTSTLEGVGPMVEAARLIRDTQTKSIFYVSGLFGDVRPIIELSWEGRHYRDAEFTVANPCDTDENHGRYRNVARALQIAGVWYLRGKPSRLLEHVLV